MSFFHTNASCLLFEYFKRNFNALFNYEEINGLIKKTSGINNFFATQEESTELLENIKNYGQIVADSSRREYGDFQTNLNLSNSIVEYILSKHNDFEFLIEPTCGKGNFIISALELSKSLKKIVGVEIYEPYVWETKFKILDYFLNKKDSPKPEIDIIHGNTFEFSYDRLAKSTKHFKTLIVGNPPWVTNSELSSKKSTNLPDKSNFKKHNGMDAITGKGNFDIGESIALTMLKNFEKNNGVFAFLIKNSVIKNILFEQKRNGFKISNSEKLNIDSNKEFNVSVNASLFLTHLNKNPGLTCKEFNFYSKQYITEFGWHKNKFVNSVDDYDKSNFVDGKSVFNWRSGIKHDCSKIMEIEKIGDCFKNNLGEEFKLEETILYGLLKSSDLKGEKSNKFRKFTIITQKKIGQKTDYIKEKCPLTYEYLMSHQKYFENRKSSIYKGNPDFSIFGVGDYSFANYKVAISGLYKSTNFTLVMMDKSKPVMLDDTCYFIGFNKLKMAQIAHYLLNCELTQKFLKSVVFFDSKRPINKDILMRIDFQKAWECSNYKYAKNKIKDLRIEDWNEFGEIVKLNETKQMELF